MRGHIPSALLLQTGARSRVRFQLHEVKGRQPAQDMVSRDWFCWRQKEREAASLLLVPHLKHMAEASGGPFVRRGFAGLIDSAKARNSEGLVSLKK